MTRYEQTMYERDLPGIRKSLEKIAKSLETLTLIISDPGDEVEHIEQVIDLSTASTTYPVNLGQIRKEETQVPDDYRMD